MESGDRRMLGGVLDLADMDVGQVMVHRTNITLLDADQGARELIAEALEAPFTRLPLYRGEPDNIVGVLHAKDLARAMEAAGGDLDAIDISSVATAPWFIPDTTNLKDQLQAFLKQRNHFALIVDEYGALRGLVTLEDILEEIVGEIEDEHDDTVEGVRRQPDGSVNVDGSVAIRDLNRAFDWNLPDDEWVTGGRPGHPRRPDDPGTRPDLHLPRAQVPGAEAAAEPDHGAPGEPAAGGGW